jgi:hypothetical protein
MDEGTQRLLQQPDTISAAIRAAAQIKREELNPALIAQDVVITSGAEDIGYSDFYNLAFRVFGYDSRSTHYLYVTVIALSLVLFVFVYRRENLPVGIVALGVSALFLATSSGVFSVSVPAMASNRFLSTMALIPCLHVLSAILRRGPFRTSEVLALLAQAAIIALAAWTRSSALWTAIAVFAVAAVVALLRSPAPRIKGIALHVAGGLHWFFGDSHPGGKPAATSSSRTKSIADTIARFFGLPRPLVVPLLLLITLISADVAGKSGLDSRYFRDDTIPRHLVWHSAYMALALHPLWPERLPYPELAGVTGDALSGNLSRLLFQERGIPFTNSKGGMRWRVHEAVLRSAYLDFLRRNPGFALQLFVFYKPQLCFQTVDPLVASIPAAAWLLAAISLGFATALFAARTRERSSEFVAAFATMFFCSLVPTLWAYPAPHVIADQLWSTIFLCMLLIAWGAAAAVSRGPSPQMATN